MLTWLAKDSLLWGPNSKNNIPLTDKKEITKTQKYPMRLDPTKKTIIQVSIIMLLFFGTIFGILTPTLIRIRKTARESLKLRLFLEQKYQESLNSRITRKKLSEIKSAAANFENFIFKSGDELRLITFLESSAAKFSVT